MTSLYIESIIFVYTSYGMKRVSFFIIECLYMYWESNFGKDYMFPLNNIMTYNFLIKFQNF